MIRAEYPKVCQYLQEEKQKHLEMLAIEGTVIFQRLTKCSQNDSYGETPEKNIWGTEGNVP